MIRVSLPFAAAAIAACTPSPQEKAMTSIHADRATSPAPASGEAGSGGEPSSVQRATGSAAGDPAAAAQGPIAEPVSAAENPLPARTADTPAEAEGRRTLSTAFVRIGPDGHLTVELRSGRVLVLRDVVMRPKEYCGIQVGGGPAGAKYCGGYAEVAAARPGGGPAPAATDSAAANPLESGGGAGKS